jgi:hypothetical protein
MLTFICVSLGAIALTLYTEKGRNLIKFSKILIQTLKDSSKNVTKYELSTINNHNIIKYGDINLTTFISVHHYDVICFESENLELKEHHNFNPAFIMDKTYPVTLIRCGVFLGTIPFKPSGYGCKNLFVAIKHMSHDSYSVYPIKEEEYINIRDIINSFENYLENPIKEEAFLAEAYD